MPPIDATLVERLYQLAGAHRWDVPRAAFADALDRCVARTFAGKTPGMAELERYFGSLYLTELALACACSVGHEAAWEHFVLEYRPALYKAAAAIDHSGSARELADSLYAELFGLRGGDGERRSLFRYFHGRSTLATWLRAVMVQRHVDQVRARARLEPLPDDQDFAPKTPGDREEPSLDRSRFFSAIQRVLVAALAALASRDRLRLACYYAQGMTLAEVGRLLREHEATVSRNLAKTRRAIRDDVEHRLRQEGFGDREVDECFASVMSDPGTLDLASMLTPAEERKKPVGDRSTSEGMS